MVLRWLPATERWKSLSIIWAWSGMCSQMRTPATIGGIELNLAPALVPEHPAFGSYISMWEARPAGRS